MLEMFSILFLDCDYFLFSPISIVFKCYCLDWGFFKLMNDLEVLFPKEKVSALCHCYVFPNLHELIFGSTNNYESIGHNLFLCLLMQKQSVSILDLHDKT